MEEEKKEHRSVAAIQAEYQNLCAKAGHLQYSIQCFKDDLSLVNGQLRELNLEAAASAAAQNSKQASEEKKDEEVSNA